MENIITYICESNKKYVVNQLLDAILKSGLTILQISDDKTCIDFFNSVQKDSPKVFQQLLNNLHKYNDKIPELLGNENVETFVNYLHSFMNEDINKIKY